MAGAAIDVALGIEPNLNPVETPQGVAIRYFTPAPGVVLEIEGQDLLNRSDVYDSDIYVKPGDTVHEVKSSTDRSGHVIVTASNVQRAIELADFFVREVKIITQ